QPGAHFFSNGASISGGVTATSPAVISICDTRIAGGLSISGATGPVLVGEPASGDCPGNRITGAVAITGDTQGTDFSATTAPGEPTPRGAAGAFACGALVPTGTAGAVAGGGTVGEGCSRPPGGGRGADGEPASGRPSSGGLPRRRSRSRTRSGTAGDAA